MFGPVTLDRHNEEQLDKIIKEIQRQNVLLDQIVKLLTTMSKEKRLDE